MKSYEVEISENLRKIVTIEARNDDEAISNVREAWKRSEYVLDAGDFLEVGFEIVCVTHS